MKTFKTQMKWIVWTLAAIFYLYEFFLRVAPSVIVSDLMKAFSLDAAAVGILSAFYFYIYAPLQLPVGILTDHYGARKILSLSAITAGLGTLLFGIASTYWMAAMGRFLMGAGSAFGFVGMVFICSHWFEESKRGIMIGFANTIGMMGAILGQGPLRLGLNQFGWRETMTGLAIFGISLGALIFLVVRDDPNARKKLKKFEKPEKIWHSFTAVAKNKYSWINGLCALLFYLSTETFGGLWGVPFLVDKYGITVERAGFAVSMIFVGWAIGGPLIGAFSDKFQDKRRLLILSALIGAALMAIILYLPLPLSFLYPLFFLTGVILSAELLCFGYALDINPLYAKGSAAAFTNFTVILGTIIFQPFVGYLLDLFWAGQLVQGARSYPPIAYSVAMSCFPIALVLAAITATFLKQTKAKQA